MDGNFGQRWGYCKCENGDIFVCMNPYLIAGEKFGATSSGAGSCEQKIGRTCYLSNCVCLDTRIDVYVYRLLDAISVIEMIHRRNVCFSETRQLEILPSYFDCVTRRLN